MVGTYGLHFKLFPGAAAGQPLFGEPNNYTDVAGDFQFQFIGENQSATLKGTYVKENRALNGSRPRARRLHRLAELLSIDLTYWYMRRYGLTSDFPRSGARPTPSVSVRAHAVRCGRRRCMRRPAGTPGAYPWA